MPIEHKNLPLSQPPASGSSPLTEAPAKRSCSVPRARPPVGSSKPAARPNQAFEELDLATAAPVTNKALDAASSTGGAVTPPKPRDRAGAATQHSGNTSAADPLSAAQAQARQTERLVGKLAVNNPRAGAAVDDLLDRCVQFLREHAGLDDEHLLAAFAPKDSRLAGAVRPEHVAEALKRGNLREKLVLVDNAKDVLGDALFVVAKRPEEARQHLEASTTLRVRDIVAKQAFAIKLGSWFKYDWVVLNPDSPLKSIQDQRTPRVPSDVPPHAAYALEQTERRLSDFDLHSDLPLSNRERWNLILNAEQGVIKDGRVIPGTADSGYLHGRLGFVEGGNTLKPNADHAFIQEAHALGLPTRAGISGHTYRFLSFYHDLGASKQNLVDLRTACLGLLTPQHHSYHEVMASAAEFAALPYDPSQDTAEKLLAILKKEAPKR